MIKIGALIENGNHFVGAMESGAFEDSIADGVRTRTVTNVYLCLKTEVRDVISALDLHPANLLSDGGRNPDGTMADYIGWGAGYAASGNDISEISPGMSRVTAKYTATDPVGGAAVARSGSAGGGIIGKPWDDGLRYAEMPGSGSVSEDRTLSSGTWTRTRTIDLVITCLRTDARTVADSLDTEPDDLVTRGVSWGAGYEMVSMTGQPVSPSFYQITAKYRQSLSDPEAPDQQTQFDGDNVAGRPWEGGPLYAETPESGRLTDIRQYFSYSFGWNRVRTVDKVMLCLQTDVRTIIDGLDTAPANLQTNPFNSASVDWGGSYVLVGITTQSAGPSFVRITAKYRRNIAEAIVVPPSGLTMVCTAGVCTITWNGATFEGLDSGLPSLTTGFDVAFDGYVISMYCNGVKFDEFTPTATSGDKILEWEVDGDIARLKWCGETWREYDYAG